MEIEGVAGPVGRALDGFAAALDHLVTTVEDGVLAGPDQAGLLAATQGFERVRRPVPLADHRFVGELDRRGVADAVGQPSTAALLAWLLHLSRTEAARGSGSQSSSAHGRR